MSDARRSRSRAVLAFVAVVASIGAAFGACTSYARSNGEGCIKDIDCLSNYCLAQSCANPPPALTGSSYDDGGASPGVDSGGGVDSSTPGTDSAVAPDSSGGDDAGSDGPAAPLDAGADVAQPSDGAAGPDASNMDAADADELDANPGFDASPDAADAQDAFLQLSRRSFVV